MKYCRKCGMLLEDTQEICIGCGLDVSDPDNYSLYPIDMEVEIESAKEETKKKRVIVGAIILVFVLLVVLVVIFMTNSDAIVGSLIPAGVASEASEDEEAEDGLELEDDAAAVRKPEEMAEEEATRHIIPDNREVKDDMGSYYIYKTVSDDAGNEMFTTIYPEDMVNSEYTFDYTKYSDVFPALFSFVSYNEENTIRFSYMSPQHFWYMNATKGKSRTDEIDLDTYMTYLKYDGAQAYIEALLKNSYPGSKKIELVNTYDMDESIDEALNLLLKDHSRTLTGDIGDYARLGDTATYAAGESQCEAKIYEYNITAKNGDAIYCEFYVPVIANVFYYANDATAEQGSITEWYPLAVYGYESGNDELYDYYKEAFDVFINNTKMTKSFFKVNELYGDTIDSAIAVRGNDPDPLTEDMLTSYASELEGSISLEQFDSDVYAFLNSRDASLHTYEGDNHKITGSKDSAQCFFSEENQMVFITPDSVEYPGGDYKDMFFD